MHVTFNFDFQADILILAAVSEQLSTLRKQKNRPSFKNPTPPTVFAAHSSKFAQTLTTKLQRASRSRIFDFNPRSPLKKFKNFQKFLKVDFSMKYDFLLF